MKLAIVDHALMPPKPGVRGVCPDAGCAARVRSKCGDHIDWHWAHFPTEMSPECAYRAYGESDWHAHWKSLAPPKNREVTIGGRRADMCSATGFVVEIQSSRISAGDIDERETDYETMAWVVDYRARAAAFVDGTRYRQRFADELARDAERDAMLQRLGREVDALSTVRHKSEENRELFLAKQNALERAGQVDRAAPQPVFRVEHGWDAARFTAPCGRVALPRGSWGGVAKAPTFLDLGASNPAMVRIDRRTPASNGIGRGFLVNRSWIQEVIARVMHDLIEPPPVLSDSHWDGTMPADYSPQYASRTSERAA